MLNPSPGATTVGSIVRSDGGPVPGPIPPICLFCIRYHSNGPGQSRSCDVFEPIPDAIFSGEADHRQVYPGDRGARFILDPDLAEEYFKALAVRRRLEAAQARRRPDPDSMRDIPVMATALGTS